MRQSALIVSAELYLREEKHFRELQRAVPLLVTGPPDSAAPALAMGCADYLREPWGSDEFLARLARRAARMGFLCGGRELFLAGSRLEAEGAQITLEPGEARMLRALLLAAGSPVDRTFLALLTGSSPGQEKGSRAVDLRVSRLRRKLKSFLPNTLEGARLIRSRYGQGYYLDCG